MFLAYGYADNQPNNKRDACSIDIGWAVDENRQPVTLDFIDFVRVYTGINQLVVNLGETSTEITGAEDLHLDASIAAIQQATGIEPTPNASPREGSYYTLDGRRIPNTQHSTLNAQWVIVRKSDGTARKIYIH